MFKKQSLELKQNPVNQLIRNAYSLRSYLYYCANKLYEKTIFTAFFLFVMIFYKIDARINADVVNLCC